MGTRRLIVLPAVPNFFWRRRKVKFKQYHGIPVSKFSYYHGNMRPFLWRAQRVRQPPPLMVTKASGDVAPRELQPRAYPYYFRGVSHWLFPSLRSGFHQLRKTAKGQWVGRLQNYRLREDIRPRL